MYADVIKILDTRSYPGSHVLRTQAIKLKPLTVIVGGQGTGKSTLLSMLRKNDPGISVELTDRCRNIDTFYFNSELDNPRITDPQTYSDVNGYSIGYGFANAVAARFKSHGEVLEELVIDIIVDEPAVLILDEPEAGLSITNQFRFNKKIQSTTQVQYIIATHSYPIIMSNDVFSLDHWKWMPGSAYIKWCSEICNI